MVLLIALNASKAILEAELELAMSRKAEYVTECSKPKPVKPVRQLTKKEKQLQELELARTIAIGNFRKNMSLELPEVAEVYREEVKRLAQQIKELGSV